MKQTAVEWYDQQLNIIDLRLKSESITITEYFRLKSELYDQAKAMEKEQIKDAWLNSLTKGDYNSAEEYYNKTFK